VINTITNHLSLIEEDALLDSTIQFPGPLSSWAEPEGIFLTGATGFLGVYLLCELLQQTKAKIYCLVRAEDVNKAEARIKTQLACYGLSVEALTDRIIPICGDLSQPLLGLSKEAFSNLADLVDLIYHNGAEVNVVYSYTRLKASNVSGTLEVLRLAALGKTKPVHFVSTLAVFFSETYLGKTVLENTSVMIDSSLKGGYKQSKWVAEALIRQAQERGLPVVIYRAGRIWGDSRTGIMTQFNDLLSNILQGCIYLKKIPTVDTQINLVPVDYVSQSIVKLSLQERSLGQAFHLANPYSTSWNTLGEIMRSIGYPMQLMNKLKVNFLLF